MAWTVQKHEQYNNMSSTIAGTVQWHEQYNRHEQYNIMNSTITWTVQWHLFSVNVCISSITHETFIGLDYVSNTSSVLTETRTVTRREYLDSLLMFDGSELLTSLIVCVVVFFCWIYSWILFPNAWINHNLNSFRWVVFFIPLICQLHSCKYISYYTINFEKIILKSILYPALIIKKWLNSGFKCTFTT
jgi:hypothetical protein